MKEDELIILLREELQRKDEFVKHWNEMYKEALRKIESLEEWIRSPYLYALQYDIDIEEKLEEESDE